MAERLIVSFTSISLDLPAVSDWRLAKPKMHITSKADPAPDTSDFSGHVKCEHGGLALNITARRRISTEVGRFTVYSRNKIKFLPGILYAKDLVSFVGYPVN